jgi:4-hydroxy-2-oxoheptanedioate aldolase
MSGKNYLQQSNLHTKAEHRAALLTYPGNLREALRQAQADSKNALFGVAQGIPSVFVTKVRHLNAHENETPLFCH